MKAALPLPTQEYLRQRFWYDVESGELHWNCWPSFGAEWQLRYAGCHAGSRKRSGHFVRIDEICYKTSRVIWKWMTGADPAGEIDHKDVNHFNNRWINLRDSTRAQNARNRRAYGKNNLPKGVSINCTGKRFVARIVSNRKIFQLGHFDTAEEAAAAYNTAAIIHHGEFARLNG